MSVYDFYEENSQETDLCFGGIRNRSNYYWKSGVGGIYVKYEWETHWIIEKER